MYQTPTECFTTLYKFSHEYHLQCEILNHPINISILNLSANNICHALKMMHAWQRPHAVIPSVAPNMMHSGTNRKVQ